MSEDPDDGENDHRSGVPGEGTRKIILEKPEYELNLKGAQAFPFRGEDLASRVPSLTLSK